MLNNIKIIYLALLISFFAISCNNKQNKNVNNRIDSIEVSDTKPIEKRNHFLFVGKYYGKPGVFKYNIQEQKYEPVFAVQKESVISLNYSRNLNSIFFLTVGKSGTRGGLPFVNKIKFYRVNPENQMVEMIKDFGNGSQLLAQWNDDGNYEVIITSIDKTISSYFNVDKKVYNTFGRLIDEKIETYDIINDGYPSLIPNRSSTVSPSGKYGIALVNDSIFLKTAGEDNLELITISNYEINKVSWNNDEEFLFFSTITPDNETVNVRKKSELFVYSIIGDSLVSKWEGAGAKNFITFINLLVFDDGLNYQSIINIYNYKQNELVETVKIRGGCGLVNIPTKFN
ncbi:MAG: hypothetical protein DRQ01_02075 [Ignavibacteriae bacterium]|nr:MAG: hypothetical protein DRQ01_02075 [Ignavibacteriota bacterium]